MEPHQTTEEALPPQIHRGAFSEVSNLQAGAAQNKSPIVARLWVFVNSSFGLWFLSTCVVGLITFLYTEEKAAAQERDAERQQAIEKARQQQQLAVERARQNASMVTILLPYLASSDERQWKIAMEVTGYLAANGELPGELKSTLDGIVVSYNSAVVSPEQKEKIVAAAAIIDKHGISTTDGAVQVGTLPPRVYIHIADKSQQSFANQLKQALTNNNFITPGIENVGLKPNISIPAQTEVRYLKDEDRAEAQQLVYLLTHMNPNVKMLDAPKKVGSGKGARPRHFEIWFSRN